MLSIGSIRRRILHGGAIDVLRGTRTLVTGNVLSRLIGLAALPIITRLYPPDAFGMLGIFMAILWLLQPLVTLRYISAVPLPRSDGLAMNLMVLSAGLMLAMTALVCVALWSGGQNLLALVAAESLASYWWLIGIGLVGVNGYEMMTLWATRRRAYDRIAQTQVWQSTLGALVKIALGLAAFQSLGLMIGQIVTASGGTGSLIRMSLRDLRTNLRLVTRSRLRYVANRFSRYPLYVCPADFLQALAYNAPMLLTTALYGVAAAGQLGLAMLVIVAPTLLIEKTAGRAFYGEAAVLGRRQGEKIRRMTMDLVLWLVCLAMVPALILFLFGPSLFVLVFGDDWAIAGALASSLSVYLLFSSLATPVPFLCQIFKIEQNMLGLSLVRLSVTLGTFYTAHLLSASLEDTIMIFSFGMAACSLGAFLICARKIF